MNKPIIECQNVSFDYNGNAVLENINFSVYEKEFFGIIGPNGSGKTTLLKIILGLLKPKSGQIKLFGKDPAAVGNLCGYVPQNSLVDRNFPLNVFEVLAMNFYLKNRFKKLDVLELNYIDEILDKLSISKLKKRQIKQLSGGEWQRVLLGRALTAKPQLLVLDEPTSNVDPNVESDIYNILKSYQEKITIVIVSHDINHVSANVTRTACLNEGIVIHPTESISGENVSMLFGKTASVLEHHEKIKGECRL